MALAAASVSLARWYGLDDRLAEVLSDSPPHQMASLIPQLMDTRCDVDLDAYDVTAVGDLFTDGFVQSVTGDPRWPGYERWGCIFAENSLPSSSVKPSGNPPILFVVSENDELVNSTVQRQSFDALCATGYRMQYLECAGARHTEGAVWSLPEQFAWLDDRLAGKPMTEVCQRTPPRCCQATPADQSCDAPQHGSP